MPYPSPQAPTWANPAQPVRSWIKVGDVGGGGPAVTSASGVCCPWESRSRNDAVAAEELPHAKPGQGHPSGTKTARVSFHRTVGFDVWVPIRVPAFLAGLGPPWREEFPSSERCSRGRGNISRQAGPRPSKGEKTAATHGFHGIVPADVHSAGNMRRATYITVPMSRERGLHVRLEPGAQVRVTAGPDDLDGFGDARCDVASLV